MSNSVTAIKKSAGPTDLTRIVKSLLSKAEDGIVTIAPGIAQRILDEINYEQQRAVKKWRVELTEHKVRDGVWNPYLSDVHIAQLPDGSMVLVNGQHRLHAFVSLGVPVQTKLTLVPAKDFGEVRKLYGQYDTGTILRNEHELVKAAGLDESIRIAPKTAEILVKAVAIIENGMEPDTRSSGDARLKDFAYKSEKSMEWEREARHVQEILDIAEAPLRAKLRRASTMAVMLYTLRHQPQKALFFWRSMAENDGLPKRDPRNTLHVDLLTRNLSSGNLRQGVQQSVTAWNAWFEGRKIKIIKCITGAGLVISGTPMAKGGAR